VTVRHVIDGGGAFVAEYELPRVSSLVGVPRWGTLDEAIRHWAVAKPDEVAFVEPGAAGWCLDSRWLCCACGYYGVYQGRCGRGGDRCPVG
jgi:hypothetical protein